MSKTPIIVKEVIALLESKGHYCSMYNITKGKLEWCNKDICERKIINNDIERRQQEAMDFADFLKRNGHKCISYLESYPVQIKWCNRDKCTKN
jgi:hypothetical protein